MELEAIYLNKCSSDDNISTFIIDIHAIKSALANIGETALSADAEKLEQAGREKNVRLILSELPPFMEMLHYIIEKLQPKNETSENTDGFGDNHYLKEKLLSVRKACELYYRKTAKDVLAEARRKTWPQPVIEQLSALSAHLLHSDFDEAIKAIDDYLQEI